MPKKSTGFLVTFLLMLLILIGCSSDTDLANHISETQESAAEDQEDAGESGLQNDESGLEYDLTGETFRILLLGSQNPLFQDAFYSIQAGVEDAVSFLNEQSGVFGAKIILDIQVIDLNDENYINQLLEIMFADDPHIVLLAIPVNDELHETLNGQSIPVLYFGLGGGRLPEISAGHDNLFWLTPLPDEQMAFMFEKLREQWKTISPSPELPEMIGAYLTWEGEFGNMADTDILEGYFSERAFQLAVKTSFASSPNASVSNSLISSLTSDVGVLYTDTFAFGPAAVANDLTSLGMQDFFVLSGSTWCCDHIESYLYSPPFEGVIYASRSLAWWNEDANPAIVLAKEIAGYGNRKTSEMNFGYLLGLGSVDLSAEALKIAVKEEKTGGFQARSVYRALSSMENYLVMGGLFRVDYTNQNRSLNMLQLWRYDHQNGWEAVSEMEKVPEFEFANQ